MEGWVREKTHDEYGYPMVYIEWDKKHWAYNGERDGWTMEAHFDPKEKVMSDKEKKRQELEEMLFNLVTRVLDAQSPEEAMEDLKEDEAEVDIGSDFKTALTEVVRQLTEDETVKPITFYLAAVVRKDVRGTEAIVPIEFSFAEENSPTAELLLTAFLSEAGAREHTKLVLQTIKELQKSGDV